MQGDKQFEEQKNFDSNYPEIKREKLPNIKEDGILAFDPAKIGGDNINIISEGSSDDFSVDFKPFTLSIQIK